MVQFTMMSVASRVPPGAYLDNSREVEGTCFRVMLRVCQEVITGASLPTVGSVDGYYEELWLSAWTVAVPLILCPWAIRTHGFR